MKRYRTLSWTSPVPAAGAGAVITPSSVQRTRLRSLMWTFTTSAAVANRQAWLRIIDPTGVPVFGSGSQTAIVASTTTDFIASTAFGTSQALQGPVRAAVGLVLPDMWLPPNWKIQLGAVAQDVADQFSAITFMAEFAEDVWDQKQDEALYLAFLSSLIA